MDEAHSPSKIGNRSRNPPHDDLRVGRFKDRDFKLCVCLACVISCSVMSSALQPLDCSLPGSSVHGIFQARILEWVAISSVRGTS